MNNIVRYHSDKTKHVRVSIRIVGILTFLLLSGVLLICSGCGKAIVSEEGSPQLKTVSIRTYNNGSESSQFVEVTLTFDRDVLVGGKPLVNMRVTIHETRYESIEAAQDDASSVVLTIPVTAVTKGTLSITEEKAGKGYEGITDSTGKYAARPFTVDALIPSGITLADTDETNGDGFVKEVQGIWNIRCITWLVLLENGEPVMAEESSELDGLDDAVAVHGHDFLTSDTAMIAENIVDTLNDRYGNTYIFRCAGTRIYGSKLDESSDAKLDLQIYTYMRIE